MKFATAPVRRLIALSAGLAALGAAALVGLPGPARAPEMRLTAATSAPPGGAYWHRKVLWKETHQRQLGSAGNRYSVVEQGLLERWTAPDGRSWVGSRTLGTYPQSAADRKAWRRDGSPAKWARAADGQTVSLSTQPGKGHVSPERGDNTFNLAGQKLTYDEVQRLPADPNRLKSWLAEAARAAREMNVDMSVTEALPELLYLIPAPKEVRAAAYQALLTTPGVKSRGKATDGMGRAGAALSYGYPDTVEKGKTMGLRTDLIVDTGTMLLLSKAHTTLIDGKPFPDKTSTETVLQAGWTDAQPAVPSLP
ncbi:hypothetical protein ACIBG4_10115 [Nonomuraea sp. NPDC050383]|uniref:hypothetical protein n=1 Tax=Nonomuraea sp. NPDC050383 TaxID=3364362 RepID=UPI0037BB6F91